MAMSYTSYLEGQIEKLKEMLGKTTTAMHIEMQHSHDLDIENCKKGICPKVDELMHPSKYTEATR